FHAKMLQAWAVLPALEIAYLLAAPGGVGRRIGRLAAAGAVTLAVSSFWVVLVLLTPAGHRPYVDGSTDNSPISMVVGYNALSRFHLLGLSAADLGAPTCGGG